MLDISSPFKIKNEPYTIAATEAGGKNLLVTVAVLSIVFAGGIVFAFCKKIAS